MLLGLLMEALTLGAHHYSTGNGPIDPVVILGSTLIDAVDPIAALLEVFQGSVDVRDSRNRQVLESTRSSFGYRFGEADSAAFRDDDGVGACSVGGPDDRAEIVRVFDAIEDDHETGIRGDVIEFGVFRGRSESDNALVGVAAGQAGKSAAVFEPDWNRGSAREIDDFLDARASGAFRDHDSIE